MGTVRVHCMSLICWLWGDRGWAVLQLHCCWAGYSGRSRHQPAVEQMAQVRVRGRTIANQQCSVYPHNLWTLIHICLAYVPSCAYSQHRWSCCLDIMFLWSAGTCSFPLFVSWMIKTVVQPHDTTMLTLLHVSSPANGAWGVSLCINCHGFVIWVGKSATKRKIYSKLHFNISRELLDSKDQRLNSQPHCGYKDQEIWGVGWGVGIIDTVTVSVIFMEILGSWIRLKTITKFSPPKVADVG